MKSVLTCGYLILYLTIAIGMYSQSFPSDDRGVQGKLVNGPYFKHFAVLMQDSTLSGNRFIYYDSENNEIVDLPFLYIDSATFYECERRLLHPDSLVTFRYYDDGFLSFINEKIFLTCLNRYIRLYVGYIDENNKKVVCVQFVTLKEFNESIYYEYYGLDRTIFNPKVRLAYIRFEK